MTKRRTPVLVCLLFGLVLCACGSSHGSRQERATKIAAQVFGTQTASAPTATDTPTPSPTPKPSATPTRTATPLPSSTPTTTPTQAPSPTPSPTAVPPSAWPLLLLDSFADNAHDWPNGTESDDYATCTFSILNGKLRWEVQAHQSVGWYIYPDLQSVTDFYLAADVQKLSGPEDSSYGLLFGHRGSNDRLFFGISDTRQYAVWRLKRGNWSPVVDWTRSSAIRAGSVNRLVVVAQDSHLQLFINDRLVAEADEELTRGRVGLVMELYNEGDEGVFVIDNFEVRAP